MQTSYGQFVKPKLSQVLKAIGLDVSYTRASEHHLYYRDDQGQEREVLDFLGGYGAALLGHNPPAIVQAAQELLTAQVPVHAQFSIRARSGELAARLNDIVRRDCGSEVDFVTTFANTGAEAVEAAIKHAELARVLRLERLLDEITVNIDRVREAIRRGDVEIPRDLYETTDLREAVFDVRNFDELIVPLVNANSRELGRRPIFLALERSFHGKLAASVQLTYNKNFRRAFQCLGLKVRFVRMNDVDTLERIGREEESELFDLDIVDNRVVLVRRTLPQFTAFLVEPIQGEGGIHCLEPEFARAVRRFCNQHGCALVIDEIQSGMGRSGRFLASAQIGLRGDYYTLSKALGGSLAKISALMIRADLYEKDFGLMHSSTFAEDDFSAGIALAVLDQLERDDGALYRHVEARGEELRQRLLALQSSYPDVIADVRGRGLFLGVEFHSHEQSSSQIVRTGAYAETLGYLLAGYLLRNDDIRLAPTGSAPNVLRLEPPASIGSADIERLCAALDRLCQILRSGDAFHLVFPLVSPQRPKPREDIRFFPASEPRRCSAFELPRPAADTRTVRKVAFLNHLIDPQGLRLAEPSLADLRDEELRQFVLNSAALKKSAPFGPVRIQSRLGHAVDFSLYPLCVTSEQMGGWLGSGELDEIRDDIEDRIRAAQDDGCEIAGLGMYNSIVTNNCMSLAVPEVGLTSGNALTVAMSIEAMDAAMRERGLEHAELDLAIVGAAGNIASTYAAILAEKVPRLTLIGSGRDGAVQRLVRTAHAVYEAAWRSIVAGKQAPAGLVARLLDEPLVRTWLREGAPERERGRQLRDAIVARHGDDPYLVIARDLDALSRANAVLCAANAPQPFLDARQFARQAIVCDVAVPHNVDPATLAARPDLLYFQGGIVATPHGESLHPTVRAFLDAGQLYACMAETAILGLSGHRGHYSYGAISVEQVHEIAALAKLHGFGLAELKVGASL